MRAWKSAAVLAGLFSAAEAVTMRKKKFYVQKAADKAKCQTAFESIASSGVFDDKTAEDATGLPPLIASQGKLHQGTQLCRDVEDSCKGLADDETIGEEITLKKADGSDSSHKIAAATQMNSYATKFPTCATAFTGNDSQKKCLDELKNGDKDFTKAECAKFQKEQSFDLSNSEVCKEVKDANLTQLNDYIAALLDADKAKTNKAKLADTGDKGCAKLVNADATPDPNDPNAPKDAPKVQDGDKGNNGASSGSF